MSSSISFGRILSLLFLCGIFTQCSFEPDPVIEAKDGSEMLLIPAGKFLMGGREEDLEGRKQNSGYANYGAERPLHQIEISAFYMDKFEVTNAQYRRFFEHIESTGDTTMNHPVQPKDRGHQQRYVDENVLDDDQPAVGLNWFDAYAYCKWAEKRLPTEAEWEYAARGGGDIYRKYPWGNEEPNAEGIWRANYRSVDGWSKDGQRYSAPVGSYPDGVSPFGIMDMAGNADEWVQDWLDFGYYRKSDGAKDPQGPAGGLNRVIKGGSYGADRYHIRIATRLYGAPHVKTEYQGVRCAKDI